MSVGLNVTRGDTPQAQLNAFLDAARFKNYDYMNGVIKDALLRDDFSTVLQMTESLAANGLENSYCRLCRAAAYLNLGDEVKFRELVPLMTEPRGYHQPSDLYELSQQVDVWDDTEMRVRFFEPLSKKVNEQLFNGYNQ